MAGPIRVLVVDDSAFMRKIVTDLLQSDPELQVVGTGRDGLEGVEKAVELQPDVVTMDVEMPRLDGLSALRQIMARTPRPVIMLSSLTQQGADATIRALALGAVDFVSKPSGSISLDLHKVRDELVQKVKAASRAVVRRSLAAGLAPLSPVQPARPAAAPPAAGGVLTRLVVVASSTGGPGALHRLLGPLPADLRAGLLIVQHMPAGFTRSLAGHLDQSSGLTVREAQAGDQPVDGLALVAPGGSHMLLGPDGRVQLGDGPPRHGVRPAADVTLESIPAHLVRRSLILVLTGMGMDGARGAKHLKDAGAEVWAQDEGSSVVFGMPRAVAELGVVDRVGSPEEMAAWLIQSMGHS